MASKEGGRFEAIFTLVFWGVLIAGGAYLYFKKDHGEILLDVSRQPELVSGSVIFEGLPVRGGTVHVVVSDARSKRYLAGVTLPVSKSGTFISQAHRPLEIADTSLPLRITAEFRGTIGDGKSKSKVLFGEATRYLNTAPPLGERFLWGVALGLAVLLFIQLALFTGDLGPRKARWLFILMYFFTFFSLALPIVVSLMATQEDLVQSMEKSPIGLVKAKTPALNEPQWLINIGGIVTPEAVEESAGGGPTGPPAPTGSSDVQSEGGAPGEAAESAGGDLPSTPATTSEAETVESPEGGTTIVPRNASLSAPPDEKKVKGGVAVPFYVVLLAMFGAGINMTLKVPVIQRNYEDVLPSDTPWFSPLSALRSLFSKQTEAPDSAISGRTAGDIRRDLIENFMYLLSAPLLAIAMYYLLQVLAEEVTQPVLVLMAFATGLVSKAVVGGIIQFAESKLLTERQRVVDQPDVAKVNAEAKAKQIELEEAEHALAEARIKEAAAEEAAKAAEAAMREARQKVETAAAEGAPVHADSGSAKEVAVKAEQEAEAKRAQAAEAQKATAQAAQVVEEKHAEARKAVSAAEQAQALALEAAAKAAQQAEVKQSEARAAAEATEEAAKEATNKQAEAEAAVKAVTQPAQAAVEDVNGTQDETQQGTEGAPEAGPPKGD